MKIATLSDGAEVSMITTGDTVVPVAEGPGDIIDSFGAEISPDIGNPIERAVKAWAAEKGLTVEGTIHDPIKASLNPRTTCLREASPNVDARFRDHFDLLLPVADAYGQWRENHTVYDTAEIMRNR